MSLLPVACPLCHNDAHLNPTLILLVSRLCLHVLCTPCVERLFSNGTRTCNVNGCKQQLKRSDWAKPTYEDLIVEKEVRIRRECSAVFNKTQAQFGQDDTSLRAYNDYLEDCEDIVFNLVNNIDLPETRARFEVYKLQQVLDSQERENAYWVEEAEEEEADYFDPLDSPQSRLIEETVRKIIKSTSLYLWDDIFHPKGSRKLRDAGGWVQDYHFRKCLESLGDLLM